MRLVLQVPLLIHEVLPNETMAIIFEEHAKLEWRAPAIDGRVCRLWRQITLNTPRAWSYLEIGCRKGLRLRISPWLDRSRTAPLHIRVDENLTRRGETNNGALYELLHEYHTRIASLRILGGIFSFFHGQDFPSMQHLEVVQSDWPDWPPPPCSFGHMPKLRSLRLDDFTGSLDCLAPLKVLVLFRCTITSLSQHSPPLVSLMLDNVELGDPISGSVDFPSLTYLSLSNMSDLKPHINTPRLVTHHECSDNAHKLFSAPLHSLAEYGVWPPDDYRLDLTEWHHSFPNISRLSIWADPPVLISILDSLSIHPHLLPALQIISVRDLFVPDARFTRKEQGTMEDLVRVRSEACHLDVALYFETEEPFHIPLFFAMVSH